ncbi:NAD(P)-binding protein [Cryphonectria parasitica EP155]|uniref:NAD(P)-binding protein n=1 Tax=Cryphonectria parasitica (strain ATCC 38755 / EP155) TaxID=660469 RepID=A0A9P5CT00_CRYP1|nr:NAD(P)-binding protein [Cryphonectria parasitica EP155]KAF3769157.1 NAD(P)-binding protein [Cryphonectria parasitica EP155]
MASVSPAPKILLTGATGYIGGTILTNLLNSSHPTLEKATFTCLIRGSLERGTLLSSTYGARVQPIAYTDLNDLELTTQVASEHDIVINAGIGYHAASAQALLHGLAQRKAAAGRDVWMIHTSGTSNLGEQAISKRWVEEDDPDREFDDERDDVYGYEKSREEVHSYIQRSTELSVVDQGRALGVETVVVMPPLIYGFGTGLFNKKSVQIPSYVRSVLEYGRAVVLGDGTGVRDFLHVEDLAALYRIVVLDILEKKGMSLPRAEKAIIFSAGGRFSWMDIAQCVADVCLKEGRIKDRQVRSIGLEEGVKIFSSYLEEVDEDMLELGLSGNSRTVSSVAKRLGWKPTRTQDDWQKGLVEDIRATLRVQ